MIKNFQSQTKVILNIETEGAVVTMATASEDNGVDFIMLLKLEWFEFLNLIRVLKEQAK